MEIIIVRHGDPDYENDSLTDKGKVEARLLAERLSKLNITAFYQSPLGRAKKTASYTLNRMNRNAETLPWLHEFKGQIDYKENKTICWDRLPSQWVNDPIYYSSQWFDGELFKKSNVKDEYLKVCKGVDKLLKKHGYIHNGNSFKVENSNHDRIVLFCHFGVEAVILSHLFSVSPMIFWHNFAALTSSVTTLTTEEREEGTAVFRMNGFGDLGHLYAGNESASFQCRFCECFDDDTRH